MINHSPYFFIILVVYIISDTLICCWVRHWWLLLLVCFWFALFDHGLSVAIHCGTGRQYHWGRYVEDLFVLDTSTQYFHCTCIHFTQITKIQWTAQEIFHGHAAILYFTILYYTTILYFAWIKYLLVCLLAYAYFECIVVSLDEIFCIDLLDHNFCMEARVGSIALSAINLLRFAPSLCSRRENVCRSPVVCWTTDCFRDLARQTPWSFTKSYQLEQTFLTHPCPPKRR
jgi:hypothetical protein